MYGSVHFKYAQASAANDDGHDDPPRRRCFCAIKTTNSKQNPPPKAEGFFVAIFLFFENDGEHKPSGESHQFIMGHSVPQQSIKWRTTMNYGTAVISDCYCRNAAGRQSARIEAIFGNGPKIIGARSDLEASGQLIDYLDARLGAPSVVFVNVAPRGGSGTKHKNGSPFGHVRIGNTHIFSTLDGFALSFVKKFELATTVDVIDLPSATAWGVKTSRLSESEADWISTTQFRSFELPRIAKWIVDDEYYPLEQKLLASIVPDPVPAVWYVDHPFGNVKTTILGTELPALRAEKRIRHHDLPQYDRLSDAPVGEPAWVTGSSGIGPWRFAEVVIRGGNAASRFRDLQIGALL